MYDYKKITPYLLVVPLFLLLVVFADRGVFSQYRHFLAQATPTTGTTYYVDAAAGNDSNDGMSPATAWQTIAKVNTTKLQPGDSVLFKSGGTYFGTISVNQSGASDTPITFASYGNGPTPVISGFASLSGWTQDSEGIWEAPCTACTATPTVVTMNDTVEPVGRYPNADAANGGYLTYSGHTTGQNSITDTSLATDWTGAEAVVRTNHWTIDRRKIVSQSNGTLTLASNLTYVPIDGYGYFIQNDPRTLDEPGEWYYNPTTKVVQMYFGNTDPTTATVNVSAISNLMVMNGVSNIAINGLAFEGVNSRGIYIINGQNITISNSTINDAGQYAIFVTKASNLTIKNNSIINALNSGIVLQSNSSDTVDIENNTVNNTGIIPGMSLVSGNTAMSLTASNIIVQNNTIRNSGYSGIYFYGNNVLVKNNIIDIFNTVKDDGGGIYTFNGYGSLSGSYNQKIIGNIVTGGSADSLYGTPDSSTPVTVGIYMDNNTNNVDIAGNTVANNEGVGIFLHVNNHITVENNIVFNNSAQLWVATTATADSPDGNNNITGNIFGTNNPNQLILDLGLNNPNKITGAGFGTFANNYYVHPTGSPVARTAISPGTPSTKIDFSTWQTTYSQDVSTKEIVDESPFFQYNATAFPSIVSLDGSYQDKTGAVYAGSITLPPFSGTILTKASTPIIPPAPAYVAPAAPVSQTVTTPTTVTVPTPAPISSTPTPGPITVGGVWSFLPSTTGVHIQTTAPASQAISKNLTLSVVNTRKDYTITQVDYMLDGTLIHSSKTIPDNWTLDTTTLKDGTYTLVTTLYYADKRTEVNVQSLTVDNTPTLLQKIQTFINSLITKVE